MKIHSSLIETLQPLPQTNTFPSYQADATDNHLHLGSKEAFKGDTKVIRSDKEMGEQELTKLECVTPVQEDLRMQLSEFDQLRGGTNLYTLTTPSMNTESCQLSPQSETSCINFSMYQVHPAPTPPSSDLEDCINNVPSSYYSLSPPDLLSPPMSTSDPCMSPGDSMSPCHTGVSPPHVNSPTVHCSVSQSYPPNFDNDACGSINQSIQTRPLGPVVQKTEQSSPTDNNHIDNNHVFDNNHFDNNSRVSETMNFLSSANGNNQEDALGTQCDNCPLRNCSCTKQSKLKQLFNSDSNNQVSSFETKPTTSNNHQDEVFMKSMDLHDDKNSKESLKVSETIEAISNATNSNERANIQPGLQSKSTSRSQTSACALPADIPTLESLSKTSPKLSTWRQTRIISEKLEQHLWTWRCACKKSGKRISKSLLQARAKWAFRKAGIVEFKVIFKASLVVQMSAI